MIWISDPISDFSKETHLQLLQLGWQLPQRQDLGHRRTDSFVLHDVLTKAGLPLSLSDVASKLL